VNIKIAGKWTFLPLKMVLIGIDPYAYLGDCSPADFALALPLVCGTNSS
jgi:hypothetical protein